MARELKSTREVMALKVGEPLSAVIASSAVLSGAVNIGGVEIVRVSIPSGWESTAANVTFQVSDDGTNYYELYYFNSAAPATPAAADLKVLEGNSYAIPSNWFAGVQYVKVRSGTVGATAAQATNQMVTLIQKLV